MRRLWLGLIAPLLLLHAGCGGSNPAKNPSLAAGITTVATSATTTSTTLAPSTSSTGRPAATSTIAAVVTTTTSASTPCSPNGTTLKISAQGIEFNTKCLAAPAGQAFSIAFDNQDPGTPHNVAIYTADPAAHSDAKLVFRGDLVTGIAKTTYQVGPQPAASYFFHCDVHPTIMTGTFIVK
jgi:hypothetical protein